MAVIIEPNFIGSNEMHVSAKQMLATALINIISSSIVFCL